MASDTLGTLYDSGGIDVARLIELKNAGRPVCDYPTGEKLDPPSPMPWRCFDLGAACARVLARSPGASR